MVNHPNCPICSNIADYDRANRFIRKLHRIYIRDGKVNKRSFKGIGWCCKQCGFTISNYPYKTYKLQKKKNKKLANRNAYNN